MQTELYNQNGEKIKTVEIPDNVFNLEINKDLLHQVIVAQESNKKTATAHTKRRGEVRGGGKKPWKQKGSGRARHGSIRSPIWKGGGVIFGPTSEINFKKKINKKVKRKAILMSLSSKVKDNEFVLVDDFKLESPKTKKLVDILMRLVSIKNTANKANKPSVLMVIPQKSEDLKRASSNIASVSLAMAKDINASDILAHKYLFLAKDSIGVIEKLFSK